MMIWVVFGSPDDVRGCIRLQDWGAEVVGEGVERRPVWGDLGDGTAGEPDDLVVDVLVGGGQRPHIRGIVARYGHELKFGRVDGEAAGGRVRAIGRGFGTRDTDAPAVVG